MDQEMETALREIEQDLDEQYRLTKCIHCDSIDCDKSHSRISNCQSADQIDSMIKDYESGLELTGSLCDGCASENCEGCCTPPR